jgi:hypothetical protein
MMLAARNDRARLSCRKPEELSGIFAGHEKIADRRDALSAMITKGADDGHDGWRLK